MVGISTCLKVIQQKKTFKTQQICFYRHAAKNSELFLLYFRNNFADLVSIPLQFIIPWYTALISKRCILLAINSYCLMGTKAVVVVRQEYNALVVVASVAHWTALADAADHNTNYIMLWLEKTPLTRTFLFSLLINFHLLQLCLQWYRIVTKTTAWIAGLLNDR